MSGKNKDKEVEPVISIPPTRKCSPRLELTLENEKRESCLPVNLAPTPAPIRIIVTTRPSTQLSGTEPSGSGQRQRKLTPPPPPILLLSGFPSSVSGRKNRKTAENRTRRVGVVHHQIENENDEQNLKTLIQRNCVNFNVGRMICKRYVPKLGVIFEEKEKTV